MEMMNSTMQKTLSSQATDWREGRRLRAYELKEQGCKQTQIADALGLTEGAVSQWMKRAREQGVEGLRDTPLRPAHHLASASKSAPNCPSFWHAGKLLVIWDGSPIHRGGAFSRIFWRGERPTGLNWSNYPSLRSRAQPWRGDLEAPQGCVELENLCCQSLSELKSELRKAKERLRHKRDVILGCIRQPGFQV
jgi:Helix-turn-helix domain